MTAGLAEFLAAALLMELTPGPNMSWLALLSLREGRIAGLRAVLGIMLGLTMLGVLSSVGVAGLMAQQPWIANLLRWTGVAFMLFLAWEAWVGERGEVNPGARQHFWRGVVVNLLNPKAAAVFLAVIPSFADSAVDGPGKFLFFSAIYIAIATLVHASIVVFSGSFRSLVNHPGREKPVRRIFAVLLAAIAIWMATLEA